MSKQTIFRHTGNDKVTVINNSMLRDKRLSFEARGVLAFILSLPTNWEFRPSWLMKETDIGKDRLYRILKELADAGYCERRQTRTDAGTLSSQEYVFHGVSLAEQPCPANPHAAKPHAANPPSTKKESDKERLLEKKDDGPSLVSSARVSFDGERLILSDDERSDWLEQFGGDGSRLDLALVAAAGYVQAHSSRPLLVQVRAQLARVAADKRDRDQRYATAAKSNGMYRPLDGAAVSKAIFDRVLGRVPS